MQNAFVKIQNDGVVDVNGFRLIGASSKEDDDSKIGFFGSGTKYAMAVAFRRGIPLRIFAGEKEVKLSLRKTKMRDETYEVICINGTPTSITTRMGKDWEDWFVFREFFCNALDEGGSVLSVSNEPKGEKGKTTVFLGMGGPIGPVFEQFDRYFSTRRLPILTTGSGAVYDKIAEDMVIYRRGVRVFSGYDSFFDYRLDQVRINEARVVVSEWEIMWEIQKIWKDHATEKMVSLLCSKQNSKKFEFEKIGWDSETYNTPSPAWLAFLEGKTVVPSEYAGQYADSLVSEHIILPFKLCKWLHTKFFGKIDVKGMSSTGSKIVEVEASERETQLIAEAVAFIEKAGYPMNGRTVKVAELASGILGEVDGNQIYISRRALMRGRRSTTETLLHEYVHAVTQEPDESRAFEDVLLGIAIDALQEKTGIYL